MIDGNGNRAELRYDGHGRQDRWTFPSALPLPQNRPPYIDTDQATALASAGSVNPEDYEQYGYDAAGNRTSHRKRDGSTLTYQYDNLNRLLVKLVPERSGLDPSHTRDVHYGYDIGNRQLYARFDSASGEGVTNVYDLFGRLTSTTVNLGGVSRELRHEYREDGQRTRIRHPDGGAFGWSYNARAQLTELRVNPSGLNTLLASVGHDPFGRPEILTRGPGVAFTTLHYYPTDWPWILAHNLSGGAGPDLVLGFSYNPAGGISQAFRENPTDLYAWQGHYAVDRAYQANGLNQYTQGSGGVPVGSGDGFR